MVSSQCSVANKNLTGKPFKKQLYLSINPPNSVLNDNLELEFSDVFGPIPEANSREASDVVFDEPPVVYSRSHSLVGPSSFDSTSLKLNNLTLRETEDSIDLVECLEESIKEDNEFSGNDESDSDKAAHLGEVSGVVGIEDFEALKVVGQGAFGKKTPLRYMR